MRTFMRIAAPIYIIAMLIAPGTALAAKPDSFFDITYKVFTCKGANDHSICVSVKDSTSHEAVERPVTIREIHRFATKTWSDFGDLCTLRIIVDLGKKDYYLIEAQEVAPEVEEKLRDGDEGGVQIRVLNVSHHRGHVTVLK